MSRQLGDRQGKQSRLLAGCLKSYKTSAIGLVTPVEGTTLPNKSTYSDKVLWLATSSTLQLAALPSKADQPPLAGVPQCYLVSRDLYHFPLTFGPRFEQRVAQQPTDVEGGFQHGDG